MKVGMKIAVVLVPMAVMLGGADGDGCTTRTPTGAAAQENAQQDLQMQQFLRNPPVPSFDWSLERHMLIQLYAARQKATNTFSVVQSEFTGKILWSCPSMGFPLPYATQLTNPFQAQWAYHGGEGVAGIPIGQQEPNGLFTPPSADGTWVPCVDEKGRITPVYEERKVTTFLRPVTEQNGTLVPVPGSTASLTIDPKSH